MREEWGGGREGGGGEGKRGERKRVGGVNNYLGGDGWGGTEGATIRIHWIDRRARGRGREGGKGGGG